MRAIKYFLFFGGILLALVPANAFAVVDITLQSVDSAKVSTAFDVEAHLYGVDTVGAVTLTINFDQNKVQITSITSDINGVIIPGVNAIENANATGKFTIPYASTTGFVPGDDTVYATITCMTTAVGNALFEIDSVANVKDTVFPPNDITGANTNKTVSIVAHGDATKFVIIDPADTDVDTGATGKSAAKARPCMTPVAILTPVNDPGPRPKLQTSLCGGQITLQYMLLPPAIQ